MGSMTWTFANEIGRKIIHMLILVVIFGYILLAKFFTKQIALIALTTLLIIFLVIEYLRLEFKIEVPFFNQFLRPNEEDKFCSVIYFLSATIICFAVFDFRIALAALLMTTFGDMTAAIVGQKYGKTFIFRSKTLHGVIIELIVNLIVGFLILRNIYIIIAMAFVATFVETLIDELDDNLYIPIFSGMMGQLLSFFI